MSASATEPPTRSGTIVQRLDRANEWLGWVIELFDMARDTRSILRRLNVTKAMIVGHSMGGMFAARFATQHPDVTERLLLFNNVIDLDPLVYDWSHIQAPTLVYGGAEDMLAGTPAAFQEGMKHIAATIPNGKARLELLPGLGHVPFIEAPERSLPPLVAFL